jgi:hypothetical protein
MRQGGAGPNTVPLLLQVIYGAGQLAGGGGAGGSPRQQLSRGCVEPSNATTDRFYACASAFNQPIPAGTPSRPNDASLIRQLVANGPLGPQLGGTPAVYFGDNATSLVTVYHNYPTCHFQTFQIPIPVGARSPWGLDHHNVESTMAVMQTDTGAEWDLYHVSAPGEPRIPSGGGVSGDCGTPNDWSAEVVTKFDPGWTGLGNEACCSGRASHTYQGTGNIRPRDTRLPVGATWDHALGFSYAGELNETVYPAKHNDGVCTDRGKCVPAGARFQLDRGYPCATTAALSLEWQRQMCRTLQVYGLIVIDKPCDWPCAGGGVHSENPECVRLPIGAAVDGGGDYRFPYDSAGDKHLPTSLLAHMHVLDWAVWTGEPHESSPGQGSRMKNDDHPFPVVPCYDPVDATDCVQAPLDSGGGRATTVHVPNTEGPWLISKGLWVHSPLLGVGVGVGLLEDWLGAPWPADAPSIGAFQNAAKSDDAASVTSRSANPSSGFSVAFGAPTVVGSSDLTHFWFPQSVLRLRNGTSPPTVVLGVSRAGDGKECPTPEHPSYPCQATMTSRDGGALYEAAPPSGPFPLLPESALDPKTAATPSNFSSLNAFKCVNGSCTGELVRWLVDDTPHTLPGVKLNATEYLPLLVTGVTPLLLSARSGQRPIMLWDGSILMATYGYASDASLVCSKEMPMNRCYTIFFFAALKPATNPTAWQYVSRIDHTPAMSARGASVEGPCEPAVVQLPGSDGRVLSVFRVQAFASHWAALSSDNGRHWGEPFQTGTWAVSPNLLAMNNGAVVLTSGRPGIGLWLATFQAHTGVDHEILPTWQFHNVAAEHNKQMTVAALRYPEVDTAVTNASSHDSAWIVNKANPAGSRSMDLSSSTAYTSLLALEDETLLMHYDRLANGWAGPPGRLGDSDYVFSMRVKVSRKTDDDSSAVSFQPPVSAPPPDAPQARGGLACGAAAWAYMGKTCGGARKSVRARPPC